jgi:hypothetical protein
LSSLEAAGNLLVPQVTFLPHHVFEQRHFAGIHEDVDFADVGEVGHGGEQGDAGQAVVAVASHRRGGNGQQDAAQAVTDGVDLAPRQDVGNGVDGGQRSQLAVVLHAQIAVFGARVEPGDHEHRMAAIDQVLDQRIVRRQVEM